jgi:hypothetical protein
LLAVSASESWSSQLVSAKLGDSKLQAASKPAAILPLKAPRLQQEYKPKRTDARRQQRVVKAA